MPCDCCSFSGPRPLALSRRSLLGGLALGTALMPFRSSLAETGAAGSGRLVHQSPRRGEFIIRGAHVLTLEAGAGDLPESDVHVRDGVIVAVGRDLAAPSAETIDGTGFVVAPGFVDTHWHMWTSLMRNMATGTPGNGYFQVVSKIGSAFDPEDMYTGTLLSAAEAINAGITTVHDWCHNIRTPRHARGDLQALVDSGIRGRFSYGPYRPLSPQQPLDVADFIRLHDQWDEYGDDGLLTLGLGWRGVQAVATDDGGSRIVPVEPAVYRADYDAARERGLPITLHANSTPADHGHVAALERLGLLHEGFQVVHATHISSAEIGMLADRKAVITVSPYSEMTIGYGVPPLKAFLDGGVGIGLSVDTTPLTGRADMLEVMKITHNLFNGQAEQESGMTAKRALELGTLEGARSLGLSDRVGSIAVGKRADLIMIGTGGLQAVSTTDIAHMVVHSAGPSDIDMVMVDGRILKRNGRLTSIDTAELVRRATEASLGVRGRAAG